MADPTLPQEMRDHIEALGWPEHHARWHYEQRHDFWHHLAAQGDADSIDIVADADARRWGRAPFQEGAPGHGTEFLGMHRAMLQLLLEAFPQHADYLKGWATPPQDPSDTEDPVPDGAAFDPDKAEGVVVLETRQRDFPVEDDFALFLETSIRPTPEDPTFRIADGRTNLHNWLHNRWSDDGSPVNIGDPWLNLGNARFWRLHGWIDRLWTDYREAWGLSDDDPGYRALIDHHREMMAHPHGHHHDMAARLGPAGKEDRPVPPSGPSAMSRFFARER
jgi:hypothetical protein